MFLGLTQNKRLLLPPDELACTLPDVPNFAGQLTEPFALTEIVVPVAPPVNEPPVNVLPPKVGATMLSPDEDAFHVGGLMVTVPPEGCHTHLAKQDLLAMQRDRNKMMYIFMLVCRFTGIVQFPLPKD